MTIKRKIEIQAWEHPVESLPPDIRQHLTDQEVIAYSSGAVEFQELAQKSGAAPIQELLDSISADQPMFVEMFATDDEPWEIWFGFSIVLEEYQPRIRLPRPQMQLPPSTPDAVRQFHSAFGGFAKSSYCGGFMKTEDVLREASFFMMDHHEIFSFGTHFFFNYGNGDYAGWDNSGAGVMYDHERGTLRQCEFSDLYETLFLDMNREKDFGF